MFFLAHNYNLKTFSISLGAVNEYHAAAALGRAPTDLSLTPPPVPLATSPDVITPRLTRLIILCLPVNKVSRAGQLRGNLTKVVAELSPPLRRNRGSLLSRGGAEVDGAFHFYVPCPLQERGQINFLFFFGPRARCTNYLARADGQE